MSSSDTGKKRNTKGKRITVKDKNGVAYKTKDESLLMSGVMDTSDTGMLNESRDTFASVQTTGNPLWEVGDDDNYGSNRSAGDSASNLGSYHSSQNQYAKSTS